MGIFRDFKGFSRKNAVEVYLKRIKDATFFIDEKKSLSYNTKAGYTKIAKPSAPVKN